MSETATEFLAADTDEAIRDLQSLLDNSPVTGMTTLSVAYLRMWRRIFGQHRARDAEIAGELAALADRLSGLTEREIDNGALDGIEDGMRALAAKLAPAEGDDPR